ncbi:hypothetical protein ACTXT7_002172, partial [Hymenolepis weldensis]
MEPNLVGRHRVFLHWLRFEGLYIGVCTCTCIDSTVLWKKWRNHDVPFTETATPKSITVGGNL